MPAGSISAFFTVAVCVLFGLFAVSDGQDAVSNRAETQLLQLYRVLSTVASPGGNGQRLTLVLPGKILNFNDYYPGDEYVNSLSTDDAEARRVEIPRRIMQNMFRLADTVPSVNPFGGSDSGLSFSSLYRTVLGQMTVRGINALSVNKRKALMQAIDYLSANVPDPLAQNQRTNRLSLYRKYRDLYNEMKLKNENLIAERRESLPAAQFEEWFTHNYPTLQSKLDGSYLEWLVFGRKDEVESKWLQLDSTSPGLELLEAKSALRASGVSSLDRTQTVYPVYFTPSDWYRYINTTVLPMTREQIQLRIGELEGQRVLLLATRNIDNTEICLLNKNSTVTATMGTIKSKSNMFDEEIQNATKELSAKRCECVSAANAYPDRARAKIPECIEYEECLKKMQTLVREKGASLSQISELEDLSTAENDNVETSRVLDIIEDELSDMRALLNTAGGTSSLAGSLISQNFVDPNDNWLSFDYNSQSATSIQNSQYSAYSTSVRSYQSSGSYSWWSRSGGYSGSSSSSSSSASSSQSSSFSSLTQTNLTVRGKLLKVSIQRPWFRPDIFKNSRLGFLDPDLKVSPGIPNVEPGLTESQFLTVSSKYRLPQYMTGFLLARDVELEFAGVDRETSANVMRSSSFGSSATYSGSSGWGPFGFSGRSDYSSASGGSVRGQASFQASSTTSGMKIKVPGVQVIGYYSQVVDKFPIQN